MLNNDCEQARQTFLDPDAGPPLVRERAQAHLRQCPGCAQFVQGARGLEQLAAVAGGCGPVPSVQARARLHDQWRRLSVRETRWQRLRAWYRDEFMPDIFAPLVPHAALMLMFVMFSWSVVAVQVHAGWLRLQLHGFEPAVLVLQAQVQSPALGIALALLDLPAPDEDAAGRNG